MKKHTRDYSNIRDPLPEKVITPQRKIITCRVVIDQSVFKKTPEERQRLKDAKRGIVQKKRSRPGKEQRYRAYLKRQQNEV